METGTITWFEVKEIMPECADDTSEKVLVFHEKYGCAVGRLWKSSVSFWRHDGGNWQPTHWAYINQPQTS
jgi:hypothetical protein